MTHRPIGTHAATPTTSPPASRIAWRVRIPGEVTTRFVARTVSRASFVYACRRQPMTRNPEAIALAYLDAVSAKQLDRLDALVAPHVRFVGPAMTITSRDELLAALRR